MNKKSKKYQPNKNQKTQLKQIKKTKKATVKGFLFSYDNMYELFDLLITYNDINFNNTKEIQKRQLKIKNLVKKISKTKQGKHIVRYYSDNNLYENEINEYDQNYEKPNYFHFLFKKLGKNFHKKTCKKNHIRIYNNNDLKYICDFVYRSLKDKEKYLDKTHPDNIRSLNFYYQFDEFQRKILDCYLTFINTYLCLINKLVDRRCSSMINIDLYKRIYNSVILVLNKKLDINIQKYLSYKSNDRIITLPLMNIKYQNKIITFRQFYNNIEHYLSKIDFKNDKDTNIILKDSNRTIPINDNLVSYEFVKDFVSIIVRYFYYMNNNNSNNNKNSKNNNSNNKNYMQGMSFLAYSTLIYCNYNVIQSNIFFLYQIEMYSDYCSYILDTRGERQKKFNQIGNLLLLLLGENYLLNIYKINSIDTNEYKLDISMQHPIIMTICTFFTCSSLFDGLRNHFYYKPLLNFIFQKGLTKNITKQNNFIPYHIIVVYASVCSYIMENVKTNEGNSDYNDFPGFRLKDNLEKNKYKYIITIKKMEEYIDRINIEELNKINDKLELDIQDFIELGSEEIKLLQKQIIN